MTDTKKILIYDEHQISASTLEYYLEHAVPVDLEVVGTYSSYDQSVDLEEEVDYIITELTLSGKEGDDFLPDMVARNQNAKVIVLTCYDSPKYVKSAMKAGAYGFVSKRNEFSELLKCMDETAKENAYIASGLRITPSKDSLRTNYEQSSNGAYADKFQLRQKLTKREREVLELIVQAKTNREIGEQLYISFQTVGVHRKNIMRKLGVNSTITLIKYAVENQLV